MHKIQFANTKVCSVARENAPSEWGIRWDCKSRTTVWNTQCSSFIDFSHYSREGAMMVPQREQCCCNTHKGMHFACKNLYKRHDGHALKILLLSSSSPFYILQPRGDVQLQQGTLKDQTIYCKFVRAARTVVEGREYNLIDKQYYLLLAYGSSLKREFIYIFFLENKDNLFTYIQEIIQSIIECLTSAYTRQCVGI